MDCLGGGGGGGGYLYVMLFYSKEIVIIFDPTSRPGSDTASDVMN